MKTSFALILASLVGLAAAAPFKLDNGFPNMPSASDLKKVQNEAGGSLPTNPLPSKLSKADVQNLQVVATNEIFETAFFTSLLNNVTNGEQGYTDFGSFDKQYVIDSITAIRAQEELHALGANAILKNAGQKTIGSCNYMFPVQDFQSAIALAATFTDLVLGTLQEVQQTFALSGGQAAQDLVNLFGSIIGQEGEQDGAYRLIQKKVPSASPFLSAGSGAFAFNAVDQMFIVPNSCPSSSNVAQIGIPSFKPLQSTNPKAAVQAKDQTIELTTSYTGSASHVAFISGQNKPVVRAIENKKTSNGQTTFSVHFPFTTASFSKGLTVAALVKSAGPFSTPADVAKSTVAGPGLIEV